MICDIDLEKHALLILRNWEDWCNVSGIINMISKLNLEKVWTKFRQNWVMGTTLWTHKAQKGTMDSKLMIWCDLIVPGVENGKMAKWTKCSK